MASTTEDQDKMLQNNLASTVVRIKTGKFTFNNIMHKKEIDFAVENSTHRLKNCMMSRI
jgi:hypothetical protein